jgi:aryl-alcohol dehydrogenase-like predicted oxidoreductase
MKTANAPTNGASRASILRPSKTARSGCRRTADLYSLHQPDYSVPPDETLEVMQQLVKQGKVRYPACSNFASWQITQLQWLAEKHGYQPVRIAQQMYNLLARGLEQEYLPMAKELGVSTIVYNPLAGGLLTGKHRREQPGAGTDLTAMHVSGPLPASRLLRRHRGAEAFARSAGRSITSLSLNWLLTQETVDGVILGASSLPHSTKTRKRPLKPTVAETMAACDAAHEAAA